MKITSRRRPSSASRWPKAKRSKRSSIDALLRGTHGFSRHALGLGKSSRAAIGERAQAPVAFDELQDRDVIAYWCETLAALGPWRDGDPSECACRRRRSRVARTYPESGVARRPRRNVTKTTVSFHRSGWLVIGVDDPLGEALEEVEGSRRRRMPSRRARSASRSENARQPGRSAMSA